MPKLVETRRFDRFSTVECPIITLAARLRAVARLTKLAADSLIGSGCSSLPMNRIEDRSAFCVFCAK